MNKKNLMLISLLVFSFIGCSTTSQTRTVEQSGFLEDYSILEEGKDGEALLVYCNPAADFNKYDRILIDPIEIWRPEGSDMSEVPEEELKALAFYFHNSLSTELAKDYTIARRPGPGVLRIRAAITDADKAEVGLNAVTTIVPQFKMLSTLGGKLAVGTHAFVGRASVEGEFIDAMTGELLFAAVDRRGGNKSFKTAFSSWGDLEEAYDYWAERVRLRLAEERAKTK